MLKPYNGLYTKCYENLTDLIGMDTETVIEENTNQTPGSETEANMSPTTHEAVI